MQQQVIGLLHTAPGPTLADRASFACRPPSFDHLVGARKAASAAH